MNEHLVRQFCESSHRKLIVVIVTTFFGLVILTPLVDDYFDKKADCSVLIENLERAHQTAKELPELEHRLSSLQAKLSELEERSITEESLGQYRNRLVEMIRSSGCQVRRLEVSPATSRPWGMNDDPVAGRVGASAPKETTTFNLERRSISLSIDGRMQSLYRVIDELQKDKTLAYANRIQMRSDNHSGDAVTMELEMWVFALTRQSSRS